MSLRPYVHLVDPLAGRSAGDTVPLTRDEQHHLRTVLRARAGAELEVADGVGGHAPAVLGEDAVVTLTADAVREPTPTPGLEVAQALAKGRKLDDVVRVCTELGVDTVHPVAAQRSVVQLDGARAQKAVGRWQAVARAAAEQSRRAWRPTVSGPRSWGVLIDEVVAGGGLLLVAVPGAPALPRVLEAVGDLTGAPVARVVLAVGPEGGWTDQEVAGAEAAGARPVGLGPTVLRTEHAAAAGLAVLAAAVGRWG